MTADTEDLDTVHECRLLVQGLCCPYGNPDFVFGKTRGDIGMGLGVNVRVHSERHRCLPPHGYGHPLQPSELSFRFDVEEQNLRSQGVTQFLLGLTDSGIDDAPRIHAGLQRPEELTARNDVSPASRLGEEVENGNIRARLDSEASQMRNAGEG